MTGVLRLLRRPATGAVAGQGTQALAGLVLQVAALRELGGAGFAAFALGYGVLVLATALSSGLVGDSLTVLDRHEPRLRAGLHGWTALVCAGVGVAGLAAAVLGAPLPSWAGLLLGPACAVFIAEDVLRRLLMATGRFWALPAVDGTSLVLALATLAVAALGGPLSLGSFVLALLAGQSGAALVAWWCLPAAERPRGPWRRPALRAVAAFGGWRAAAQAVRPASLTLLRVLVVGAAGAAAVEPLEAARVLTAPTLILVAGIGSFLLPHFVGLRDRAPREGLRAADRAAAGLGAGVAATGAVLLALLPLLGPLLTGGDTPLPAVAVAAWVGYAVAAAALLPYASLASVHGCQRRVLAWRALEFVPLAAVLPLVALADGGVPWAPLVLALGPALTAVAVRRFVVLPVVAGRTTGRTWPSPAPPRIERDAQLAPAGTRSGEGQP